MSLKETSLKGAEIEHDYRDEELYKIKQLAKGLYGADIEEVVRCKDCKYFETDFFANVNGVPLIVGHEICNYNPKNPIKVFPDHFCSFGD